MADIENRNSIVEVLCDIHFSPSVEWDLTTFGKFYDKIKKKYTKKEQKELLAFSMEPDERELKQKIKGLGTRMQFFNEDRSRMLQLSKDNLVINLLPPYPNWNNFKEEIIRQISNYTEAVKPEAIQQLGIRYINKFSTSQKDFCLKEIFSPSRYLPDILFENKLPFMIHLEYPVENDSMVNITIGNIQNGDESILTFIFDIEVMSTEIILTERKILEEKLDIYHNSVKEIFLLCTSEKEKRISTL